jgi:hypothetical protein
LGLDVLCNQKEPGPAKIVNIVFLLIAYNCLGKVGYTWIQSFWFSARHAEGVMLEVGKTCFPYRAGGGFDFWVVH